MTRYERLKQLLDAMRPEDRRICTAKGPCACTGCVTSKGIKPHELEKYLKGELK